MSRTAPLATVQSAALADVPLRLPKQAAVSELDVTTLNTNGYDARDVNNQGRNTQSLDTYEVGGTEYTIAIYQAGDTTSHDTIVAVRENGGDWSENILNDTFEVFNPTRSGLDDHNTVGHFVDGDGYLHMSVLHSNSLDQKRWYKRSASPLGSWDYSTTQAPPTFDSAIAGIDSASYLRRAYDSTGTLYATYRQGGAGNADQVLIEYDESTETWLPAWGSDGILIDNDTPSATPATMSVYVDGNPKFDSSDNLHVEFVWRNPAGRISNHDLTHIVADLSGNEIRAIDSTVLVSGAPLQYGDATGTAAIIDPVSEAPELNTFCHWGFDSQDRPVTTHVLQDSNNYNQLTNYHWNGSSWQKHVITSNTWAPSESYVDTMAAFTVVQDDDTAQVIAPHPDRRIKGLHRWISEGSDYTSWTRYDLLNKRLWRYFPSGEVNPYEWKNKERLEVLAQPYLYDDRDVGEEVVHVSTTKDGQDGETIVSPFPRRDTDGSTFTPLDADDAVLHWRVGTGMFDETFNVVADGDSVAEWRDQRADMPMHKGIHPEIDSNFPTYDASAFGGRGGLDFRTGALQLAAELVGAQYGIAFPFSINTTEAYTGRIFELARQRRIQLVVRFRKADSSTLELFVNMRGNQTGGSVSVDPKFPHSPDFDNAGVLIAWWDDRAGSIGFRLNGKNHTNLHIGQSEKSLSTWDYFDRTDRKKISYNNGIQATLGDLVLLDAKPTVSQMEKIEGYLGHEFNALSRFPSGHPYSDTRP